MFGKRPVRRTDPKPGQSEFYYLNPRGAHSLADMKEIDVPSENSPNPYANEIQNYLYKNDEYNYKQLYGNTPPTALNQLTLASIDNNNSYTTESAWGYPNNVQSSYYQQMGKPYGINQNYSGVKNSSLEINSKQPIDYSLYGEGFSKEFIDKMLNDIRFQQIMKMRTQGNEGEYSNHSNDRGGQTKYGISSKWYPYEDIPNLSRERANAILYRDYWLKPHINQLPDTFADIVFDNGVVQGQPTAIANLQRALGVGADGKNGPNTLRAISTADKNVRKDFIRRVHQRNKDIVNHDPTQKVFLNGWTNRANSY